MSKDPNNLNQQELVEYANELGLDSTGPKSVVLHRVIQFLKQNNQYQPQQKKKRNKKKKKVETNGIVDQDVEMKSDPKEELIEIEVVEEEPSIV